ncbi:MAG: hypothetical protein HQL58_07515 [Magnetococcales bacterium]|nr:hypothetical protein [Magnetococcales bacterium]
MSAPFLASDRAFGLLFAAVLLAVSLWPWLHGGEIRLWALLMAVLLLVVSSWYAACLAPLNRFWLGIGRQLHRITNPLIMGLIFGVLFVPVGLWRRLWRRDPLHIRFDAQVESYWMDRDHQDSSVRTMKQQF